MAKLRKTLSFVVLLAFVLGVLFVAGCTKYANEDELKMLDETKAAALSAEEKVEELTAEKAELEKEIAAKKTELEKVQKEKEAVKERLSKME